MGRSVGVAAALAVALFIAGPVTAAQTGGLATNVGQGGLALSAGVGYSQRNVKDGIDAKATSRRLGFRVQFGLMEQLDGYAQLGFADVEIDDAGFKGSLGENLTLGGRYAVLRFADEATKLMVDVQGDYYSSHDGSDHLWHLGGHVATYLVREFGAAGRIGYFYPYGGLRISYASFGGSGVDDFKGEDWLGVFGGADYFVNPNVFFSGEVHVFDETSLYLGVGYRF